MVILCSKSSLRFGSSPSECAVVDHSEEDEGLFSSDSGEPLDNDSDEDFTPNMKTAPKRKNKQVVKSKKCPNKKVRNFYFRDCSV